MLILRHNQVSWSAQGSTYSYHEAGSDLLYTLFGRAELASTPTRTASADNKSGASYHALVDCVNYVMSRRLVKQAAEVSDRLPTTTSTGLAVGSTRPHLEVRCEHRSSRQKKLEGHHFR